MWNDKKTGFSDISGIAEGAVDAAIGKELKRKGIHLHRVGYIYLKDAVALAMRDRSVLHAVTKELYPAIAEKHYTSSAGVERAMRIAIKEAWESSRTIIIMEKSMFSSYETEISQKCPTVTRFICEVTDTMCGELFMKRQCKR